MSRTTSELLITEATTETEIAQAKALIIEYAEALGIDLSFPAFDGEIASFPGAYSSPNGVVLLASIVVALAGCVCVRGLSEDRVCEMKRLYVRPAFRGRAIGRRLAEAAIQAARDLGYGVMRLDTLGGMAEAISLYRSLGFCSIGSYYPNPIPDVEYFELTLTD